MKLNLLAAGVLLLSGAAASANNLYVFGDSLVDSGNVRIATGGAVPNPAQGYFQGRFTDGWDYTDLMQISRSGAPTVASLAGGKNYAWGGARAIGPGYGGSAVPGLAMQIGSYVSTSGGVADANGLYILNFGGNDIFGMDSNNVGGLTDAQVTNLLLTAYSQALTTLSGMGAQKILVTGIPVNSARGYTMEVALQSMLDGLEPTLGATLYRFSYLDLWADILTDPTHFGLPSNLDVSTPCRAVRPVVNGQIDCTGYFSFDGTHPTATIHKVIAGRVEQILAVPEPATWALLITGFGLVGTALRRRESRAAA
jgi:phospholipase/lecithinase/hemolysin